MDHPLITQYTSALLEALTASPAKITYPMVEARFQKARAALNAALAAEGDALTVAAPSGGCADGLAHDEPSLPCAASERGADSTNIAAAGPSACTATAPHSQSEGGEA